MSEYILNHPSIALAGVVALGISAQLLAQRLKLPSILLLLLFGFMVSPAGLGVINPDLFLKRDLLFAFASAAVGVILFEGGLTLRWRELDDIGRPLRMLISVGAFVSWVLTTIAAYIFLGMPFMISLLFGALLIVTGPTVIGPLLRHVRPTGKVSKMLKWEGILADPIGAILAVLILEMTIPHKGHDVVNVVALGIVKTIVVGLGLGYVSARLLTKSLKEHWIPDYLQGVTSLALVLVVFVISNLIEHESGLLTVTVMGIVMANQREVSIKHIIEFKEHLGVLFISVLFIVLSARFTRDKLAAINLGSMIFLACLIFIVRPASVFISTIGSDMTIKERAFLAWLAPRGIVAAAVASLFSLRLTNSGVAGAESLESVMFVVIIGTVSIYGLSATQVAQWLGVAEKDREGILFMGAHQWARELALSVKNAGFHVALVDTNRRHILQAKMAGLPAYHGNILDEHSFEDVDLNGIGRFLALTPNEEANSLASVHCSEEFSRQEVYQIRLRDLDLDKAAKLNPSHLRGRLLFREGATYSEILARFSQGAVLKTVKLTDEYSYEDFQNRYKGEALPFFVIRGKQIEVCTVDRPIQAETGQMIIALVDEVKHPLPPTPSEAPEPDKSPEEQDQSEGKDAEAKDEPKADTETKTEQASEPESKSEPEANSEAKPEAEAAPNEDKNSDSAAESANDSPAEKPPSGQSGASD